MAESEGSQDCSGSNHAFKKKIRQALFPNVFLSSEQLVRRHAMDMKPRSSNWAVLLRRTQTQGL